MFIYIQEKNTYLLYAWNIFKAHRLWIKLYNLIHFYQVYNDPKVAIQINF